MVHIVNKQSIKRDEHVADVVAHLNTLPLEQALLHAETLDPPMLAGCLDRPELEHAAAIVLDSARRNDTAVLERMSEDRLVDLIQSLKEDEQASVLLQLPEMRRASVGRLMVYPEGTAGSMMTTEFIAVPVHWTAGQTLDHIRQVGDSRATVYAVFVVDTLLRLQFVLSLRELVAAGPDDGLQALWGRQSAVTVGPLDKLDHVARLIRHHDFLALPVVDEHSRVVGIVTVDDVIDALVTEANEDMDRFGGSTHINKPYLRVRFGNMLVKRGGWLAILFMGEMLTASAMAYFEMELEKAVVLAMFIPLIMSSGGNSGSQATSLLIRSLALGDVRLSDWWRVAMRELPAGVILGGFLGAIAFTRVAAWQWLGLYDYGEHYLLIALTMWLALTGIVTFGSVVGSMLPFILQRIGFDPASASAPLVATLVDVFGLVIYFSLAILVLTGTVL